MILATAAFVEKAKRTNFHSMLMILIFCLIGSEEEEPSLAVGNPEITDFRYEDNGRIVHIPAPFRFIALRSDDVINKKSEVVFMLPEER